jgi:FkbM family methyltransferase
MRIKKRGFLESKFYNFLSLIISYLENNNNADFYKNGENRFLQNFFSDCKEKQLTVFDIGANVGDYTQILIHYSQKFFKEMNVHLFEPMPHTFEKLKSRFVNSKGLIYNNCGASDENSNRDIYFDHNESALASLYDRLAVKLDKKIPIKLIRLEDYITEQKVGKINLIKLDVEGHEFSALNGMGKYLNGHFIDFIQFEYGGTYIDSRTYLNDMFKLLESRGFKLFKIKRHSLEPVNYMPAFENFAYSNYVAISEDLL